MVQSEIDSGEIGESFWTEMIQDIDQDGNGEIDFEEFRDHMLKMLEKGSYELRATAKAKALPNIDLDELLLGN